MENKSFIETLFDGEYAPYDNIKLPDPQYSEVAKKAADEKEFFKQFIPKEYLERYKEMSGHYFEMSYIENLAYFKEGLRVGLEINRETQK